MAPDRARIKVSHGEQVHLIGADLFGSKLIRSTVKIPGEGLHNFQVALDGSLRVSTILELFPHHFAKLGYRELLSDPYTAPPKKKCSPCDTRSLRHADGFVLTLLWGS